MIQAATKTGMTSMKAYATMLVAIPMIMAAKSSVPALK